MKLKSFLFERKIKLILKVNLPFAAKLRILLFRNINFPWASVHVIN